MDFIWSVEQQCDVLLWANRLLYLLTGRLSRYMQDLCKAEEDKEDEGGEHSGIICRAVGRRSVNC